MLPPPHSNSNKPQKRKEEPYVQKQHQQYPRATRFLHAASAAAEQRHFQRIQRDSLFDPRRACPGPAWDRIPEASEVVIPEGQKLLA